MSAKQVSYPRGERPDTHVNMGLVVLFAFVLNLIIFGALSLLQGTFIRDLFMGRYEIDPARLLFQFSTMYMFSLSIMTVVMKRVKIGREFAALRQLPLAEHLDLASSDAIAGAYRRITSLPNWEKRIACSRAARVLAMWINSNDCERTLEYARENSEIDAMASDSSFRANRLFIWSMPLLGFLGTVFGVSYGIGGFAEFLRGESISTEDIMIQVGTITQGLAVAFYTTLVGLGTSGLSAFPNMVAERREEELLEEIDSMIEERLTARMPSVGRRELPVESIKSMSQDLHVMAEALSVPIRELIVSIEQGFRQLPTPSNYEDIFAAAIAKAGQLINDTYGDFASATQAATQELAAELRRVTDVGVRIDQLLQVSRSTEQALQQIAGTRELEQALQDLRRHLETTDQLVAKLSKPKQIVLTEAR